MDFPQILGEWIFKFLTCFLKILEKSYNNFSFYGHFVEGRRSKCPFVYIEKYKLSKNHTFIALTLQFSYRFSPNFGKINF